MKRKKAQPFEPGDRVAWRASQGRIEGTVAKTVTATTRVKGHVAKATPDHPEVLVTSARTGAAAIHRPAELTKIAKRARKPAKGAAPKHARKAT